MLFQNACWQLVPLLLLLFCHAASASSYRRWSSYVALPVKRTCIDAVRQNRVPNGIWGCNGESWAPSGPISDWSFAGYGAGLASIPYYPVRFDIKRDFKAAGDGRLDDTWAVQAAVRAAAKHGGVVYFPPGKYILSGQINLSSNTVLRGAGRDKTTLYFAKPLQAIYGWGSGYQPGKANSPYTWSGALIQNQKTTKLWNDDMFLGKVGSPATRGERRLYVNFHGTPNNRKRADQVFKPGEWMALRMYETQDVDLAKSLMNYRSPIGNKVAPMFGNRMVFTHSTRVSAAGRDWVEMERPLHVDVHMNFSPLLYKSANFLVSGIGIEDLEIAFPWTPYLGHHEEKGYNAIEFEAAVNSWVRRVRITNADAAIKAFASQFNTFSDIQIRNSPQRRSGGNWVGQRNGIPTERDGHIGIALHWACFDNLVEKFNITGTYYHDLLVAGYSAHNVFANGFGYDITLDHHGAVPHNNLWTDIDVGLGKTAMNWSGDREHYPYAGSNNVFWNIYASKMPISQARLSAARTANKYISSWYMRRIERLRGPDLVYFRSAKEQGYAQVAVDMPIDTSSRYIREAGDWLIQYDPGHAVYPKNLYIAQKATQASRLKMPSGPKIKPASYPLQLARS